MKEATGFFVTGTDTEVGKTLVSGALIVKLRDASINAVGFKPVVAGTYINKNGQRLNEDLETLRIASNLNAEQVDICPYILDTPAAPHLAAKAQAFDLRGDVILQAFHQIAAEFDAVIVEGAGGFLVPLNPKEDLGDIAQSINLPVILVVGMRLGCINHALLSYEALKARNLTIAGWVANTLSNEMPLLDQNIQTLKERMAAPYLGLIPSLPEGLEKMVDGPYSLDALQFAAKHINTP
jgi:dethiobiotin synthetase